MALKLFLFLNFLSVAVALLFLRKKKERSLLLFPLFFPGVGWLVFFFLTFSILLKPPRPLPFEEEEMVLPFAIQPLQSITGEARQEKLLQETDFSPLADILAGEEMELKRGAIERLALLKTPEAITLLLAHRSDASLEIRFFITSALTRIKKEFDESLEAAKKEMQKDVYKISARIFLAKIYLQYVRSGLLDSLMGETYENEAMHHLHHAAASPYANSETVLLLIDLHRSRREWEKVLEITEQALSQKKISSAEAGEFKVECFYHLRRFNDVKQAFADMQSLAENDSRWNALSHWWAVSS